MDAEVFVSVPFPSSPRWFRPQPRVRRTGGGFVDVVVVVGVVDVVDVVDVLVVVDELVVVAAVVEVEVDVDVVAGSSGTGTATPVTRRTRRASPMRRSP